MHFFWRRGHHGDGRYHMNAEVDAMNCSNLFFHFWYTEEPEEKWNILLQKFSYYYQLHFHVTMFFLSMRFIISVSILLLILFNFSYLAIKASNFFQCFETRHLEILQNPKVQYTALKLDFY